MDGLVENAVKRQMVVDEPENAKFVSTIDEDNEIKTVYAVNNFGSRQLILDFFVPHWLFKMDKSVSKFVQRPAQWKHEGGILLGFYHFLYYTAVIVNCRYCLDLDICSIEATAGLILLARLLEVRFAIVK